MTRNDDVFVALDQRTTFANKMVPHADIFLSIHVNSSLNKNDAGIQTFYLDPVLFKTPLDWKDTQYQKIVLDIEGKRSEQSKLLAQLTHQNVIQEVYKEKASIMDHHVHPTVLQVLLGTSMPAILVEVGYLSNKAEAQLLSDKQHQQYLAQGICKGVVSYFNSTKVS